MTLSGAHITLLPQLKSGEKRKGMEEVFFLPFLFARLSISVCFKLASSIFAYLNRCLAREWSSRWCALGPPTPSATGAVRRLSTGGNGADDGDVDVGVDVDLVADVNLDHDQTILLTIARVWVRGDQLTKVATKFGGPGYRPPRQQSLFFDMLTLLGISPRFIFGVGVFQVGLLSQELQFGGGHPV